jgi:hypothetical protein
MSNRKYNILEFLINYCEDNSPSPTDDDVLSTWDELLDEGFSTSAYTQTICCDECDLSGTTVFASIETFLKYAEAVSLTYDGTCPVSGLTCCISAYGNINSYDILLNSLGATGDPPFQNCINIVNDCPYLDFNTVLNRIISEFGYNTTKVILDKGVVLLGNISIKCLLDYLDTKSENFRGLFLLKLLDKGMIYDCQNEKFAGVETWLKYAEAVGLTSSAAVP